MLSFRKVLFGFAIEALRIRNASDFFGQVFPANDKVGEGLQRVES